jgi:anti-sigma regulatory factor (Ser/Thr protein kinase)
MASMRGKFRAPAEHSLESRLLRRNAFRLPHHPASVGVARLRVRAHLAVWEQDDPGIVEPVLLIVSELVTNAVRHGPVLEREFDVAVTVLADGSCVIEVSDSELNPPVLKDPKEEDESGRGLRLVETLADTRGVRQRGRYGKTVWAVLGAPVEGGSNCGTHAT